MPNSILFPRRGGDSDNDHFWPSRLLAQTFANHLWSRKKLKKQQTGKHVKHRRPMSKGGNLGVKGFGVRFRSSGFRCLGCRV